MFFVDGLIGALTVMLIWIYLPKDRPHADASVVRELIAFTRPQVLLTLLIAASGFGGMFSIFSLYRRDRDRLRPYAGGDGARHHGPVRPRHELPAISSARASPTGR